MSEKKWSDIRKEYSKDILSEEAVSNDPIQTFRYWFEFAVEAQCTEVNAMVLSTVNEAGRPDSRVVLLKDITDKGFTFFTNYSSRKGRNLLQNPYASLNFFWPELERQVRIEGKTEKTDKAYSQAYFQSRPRLSQAGAIASPQSEEIPDRIAMEKRMDELMALPENTALEKPEHWGGYLLIPDYMEFWQGRPGRLHDRIAYELNNGIWRKFRLAP